MKEIVEEIVAVVWAVAITVGVMIAIGVSVVPNGAERISNQYQEFRIQQAAEQRIEEEEFEIKVQEEVLKLRRDENDYER